MGEEAYWSARRKRSSGHTFITEIEEAPRNAMPANVKQVDREVIGVHPMIFELIASGFDGGYEANWS